MIRDDKTLWAGTGQLRLTSGDVPVSYEITRHVRWQSSEGYTAQYGPPLIIGTLIFLGAIHELSPGTNSLLILETGQEINVRITGVIEGGMICSVAGPMPE
jgi:hypothetical protein